MKSDLDALLQARNFDGLLITGPAAHNPAMFYMTGGVHLGQADLIQKRGEAPLLFYNSMERDEAARTGIRTKGYNDYNLNDLIKDANGDYAKAIAHRYAQMFTDAGLTSGRVVVAGLIDAGYSISVFNTLREFLPNLELVGEVSDSLILAAMATKGPQEIERIRQMGRVTTRVVGLVADFLTSHKVNSDEILVKSDGQLLTIGEVKNKINLWLSEQGADNPQGTIFSIGRDAAVPHSTGCATDPIRLGKTIVFDIFPCEAGGGYFYDFTRTWCLGYAPEKVQDLYQNVRSVFQQIMSEIKVGDFCPDLQKRVCDLFEAQGHATIRSNPQTEEGYVHGLGHGVGLNVHERPAFGKNTSELDRLAPGSVVTIEPGLYYPDLDMGVRLEDTLAVLPDGKIEVLAEFPLDLVLPMQS